MQDLLDDVEEDSILGKFQILHNQTLRHEVDHDKAERYKLQVFQNLDLEQ